MSNAWKEYSIVSDLIEMYKEEEKEFNKYVETLCKKNYTVILFGSRARGDNKVYSDYDILVIGYERPPFPPNDVIDMHYVPISKLEEKIRDFNTTVIDAFYEGKVLCDNLNAFKAGKEKVNERIIGYKKTKEGWIREGS